MKPLLSLLILFASINAASADKYTEQMSRHIQAIYAAQSAAEYQNAINAFDRIAAAEKSKWEPYYYSAYGNIMLANQATDASKKDAYLDLAKSAIDKGKALVPAESELVALEGFVNMIRITVDPASRGAEYSGATMQLFGKAASMNPNNPRALALMAQMQLGTARFFNQAPTEACQTARQALALFEKQQPSSALAPMWGKAIAESVIGQCK